MTYYDDGNLARQLTDPYPYQEPVLRPEVVEAEKRARQRALQRQAQIRRQYKAAGRMHARAVLRVSALLLAIASLAGFIVWRNARITEMSFINAGLRRQISELDKQNGILEDKIAKKVSLQTTREQAAEQLGMQQATSDQIHYVSSIHFLQQGDQDAGQGQDRRQVLADSEWLDAIETWVKNH
jgi:cell division protein FtsL